jgi:integrase
MNREFRSWLADSFDRFVAIKRATGSSYTSQVRLLSRFDNYLVEHASEAPLTRDTLIAYIATLEQLSPRGRDNMVSVIWQALAFAQRHGASIDTLPPRPPRPAKGFRLREPILVFDDDMRSVLAAARCLAPTSRATTYATLYGLLFVTGMRINEALSLNIEDIDLSTGLITIHHGKFGKNRVLPIQASTAAAVEQHIKNRRSSVEKSLTDAVFVSVRGRRLRHTAAYTTLFALSQSAGLKDPLPRPHDLRHSFTVLQVVEWYRQGRDVNSLLPLLATYLGHVTVDNTRTYLRANGLLLREACRRFALSTARLDEVLS